ncbi:nucleotidyltransferase domain-containing protein [Sporosarcina sp. G11-34]|uniref:nucleotidyltransferase domain-containing protein n=1 Tax=Sporosarcina sp. G11-34 TaxID=2849605 RepID=UPI0022A9AE97|nr:nucleotidyltransferase family protein [Sporosarcina sp. G11-34]MCZ2257310.1 nucleotidyltransferase family protein [Sporosarcina sp. G11-34]
MSASYSFDLKRMPKELTLLIEMLKTTNEDNIQLTNDEFLKEIDWDHFLQLTMYHRVYPLIYLKFKDLESTYIPSFVIQTLEQEYKKNTYEMLKLSGEMGYISELFRESNIRSLFLKGPVIALDLYGDVSLRTSKDLDILISINDLDKAREVLLNYGYERQELPILLGKMPTKDETYFHPQKRVILEIHWKLHDYSPKEPNFEELWNRKRIKKLGNYPIHFMGKEDLFLYLVAHGGKHGWFRLRWLLDIHQIMNNRVNTEDNPVTLKKYHYRHLVWGVNYLGQALILASMLFHTPINNAMQSVTERNGAKKLAKKTLIHLSRQAQLKFSPSEEYLDKSLGHYFFSVKPNSQKITHIWRLFHPSTKDVETLKLPKSLRFMYRPLRPFLWAWRQTKKRSK